MTKKIVNITHKVDLELESDNEGYFGNGKHFAVAINNKKKNRKISVLKDASILTIQFLLLLIRKDKSAARKRQLRQATRLHQ